MRSPARTIASNIGANATSPIAATSQLDRSYAFEADDADDDDDAKGERRRTRDEDTNEYRLSDTGFGH